MKNKYSLLIIVVVLITASLGGFWYLSKRQAEPVVPTQTREAAKQIEQTVKTQPTVIQPTLPPLAEIIKSLDENNIIVTGEKGDMHLPKNPNIVTVLKRTGAGSLMPASFADLKVGQKTTLKIIIPGKQAELIIEP